MPTTPPRTINYLPLNHLKDLGEIRNGDLVIPYHAVKMDGFGKPPTIMIPSIWSEHGVFYRVMGRGSKGGCLLTSIHDQFTTEVGWTTMGRPLTFKKTTKKTTGWCLLDNGLGQPIMACGQPTIYELTSRGFNVIFPFTYSGLTTVAQHFPLISQEDCLDLYTTFNPSIEKEITNA